VKPHLKKGFPVKALRLAAAMVVALILAAPAQAQIVHRADAPAGDAVPTGGSFSIRFPIPFRDVEARVAEPGAPTAVLRMVTGVDSRGIRFSATESPYVGLRPEPMERFADEMKERPGATVSDMRREQKEDMEILSFSLTGPEGGYYFRMGRANSIQYMQVVQFPEAQRSTATAMKEDFFGSFRITRP
jgi:hypothetical protein